MFDESVWTNLWTQGFAILPGFLPAEECISIRNLYGFKESSLFRSRIDMKRYRFGLGEYQYFAYPLPERIAQARHSLYANLAAAATEWMTALSTPVSFPETLDEFLEQCHSAGQSRPTPLLLHYNQGGFNCLHQDLYGARFFPFQVVVVLSQPGSEYTGGELVLVEQQPRAQSIVRVISLHQGDAAVITTRYRPAKSSRGYYRANVRHGVSTVRSGERYTLGLIFHDAE